MLYPSALKHRLQLRHNHVDSTRLRRVITGRHARLPTSAACSHFPSIRRIRTGLLLSQGGFIIAPSMLCQSQAMPSISLYSASPARHSSLKKRFLSLQKALVRCTGAAKPFLRESAFHWQPVRSTNTMASKPLAPAWIYARQACGRRFSADRAHIWSQPVAPRGSRTYPLLPTT